MSTADLQSLERLLDRSPHGRDPEAGPLLQRISKDLSERRARISPESSDVFRTAATLLKRFSGTNHGESRISGLLDCFRFLYQMGDFGRALGAATAMEAVAERTGRIDDVSLAQNLQGIALTELGDVGKALLCYASSLEIAEDLGNVPRQASILGNTGMALNLTGLYREAIPCLHRSIGLNTHHVGVHSCNLAQSYLELGQFDQGLQAIERSTSEPYESADSLTAFSRCVREFTYAHLALAVDDLDLAWDRSRLCLDYSRGSSFRAEALAKIVLALCEVRAGHARKGIKSLLSLLAESQERLFDSVDCLTALVKAYDEAGQPALALDYLTRLLSLIRANRQKSLEGLVAWSVQPESDAPTRLILQESSLRARVAETRTKDVIVEMLERLALTADLKEDASGEHGRRVGILSRLLAESLGWTASAAQELELAARLHDIGKIAIPESILRQSGPLQDGARAFMRTHCETGAEMLSHSSVPSLRLAQSIALCHHEAWNGSGYPRGLAGRSIPTSARIVAITDVFDALTHDRSYSRAWTFEAACEQVRSLSGRQFDPDFTSAFLGLALRVQHQYGGIDAALDAQSPRSSIALARQRIDRVLIH